MNSEITRKFVRLLLNEVVHQLEEIAGRKIEVKYEPPRHGDIRDSQADISLTRQTLGMNQKYSSRKGSVVLGTGTDNTTRPSELSSREIHERFVCSYNLNR